MVKFVKVLAAADDNYRKNKAKFGKDSAEAKAIAKWSGAKQEDVPDSMALYAFPTAQEQAPSGSAARTRSLRRRWRQPLTSSCRRSRSRRSCRIIRWR